MKKKVLFLFLTFIYCCQSDQNCQQPVNPNGDSELALLMRQMADHAESEKRSLINGGTPGEYIHEFEKIATATPTDTKDLSPAYAGYAQLYIEALKAYHSAEKNEVMNAYNNMIQTCINCHRDECPGPKRRIEKMKLPV